MATPSNIHIRRLTPADAAAFRTLRLEALTTAPEAFGSSPEEEAARPMDGELSGSTPSLTPSSARSRRAISSAWRASR